MSHLVFAGTLVAVALGSEAKAERIPLKEPGKHVTEASMTVDASPSEVYAFVTDYARWPTLFSDVSSVSVKSGGRDDATVQFRSRALGFRVTVAFTNTRDRLISFKGIKGPPGGRASGSFRLTPVDGGKRTRIDATLYMDVVGFTGVFVTDSKIRGMRQAKLEADMTDVKRRFPSRSTGA